MKNISSSGLRRTLLAVPVLALALTGNAGAATNTWDPLLTGAGSDGTGTWTATSNNWSSGTVDVVPIQSNGDSFTLGKATGTTAYTLTMNMGRQFFTGDGALGGTLTFAQQNYTLAAADSGEGLWISGVTVNAGITGNVSAYLYSGGTLTMGSGSILNLSGGGDLNSFLNGPSTGTATLNITAGTYSSNNNTSWANNGAAGTVDVNISGGTILGGSTGIHYGEAGSTVVGTITGGVVDGGLLIGQGTGTTLGNATLTLSGGQTNVTTNSTFTVGSGSGVGTGGKGVLNIGSGANFTSQSVLQISPQILSTAAVSGTVNISGGYVNVSNGKALTFGGTGLAYGTGSTATLNLSGGTLYVGGITLATGTTGLTSAFNFSGGTLASSNGTANTWTMPIVITSTGGTIQTMDPEGASASVTENAVVSGAGGLTKTGVGTLFLGAVNTYTGATTILDGTLNIGNSTATGSISSSSALVMGGNGALTLTTTGGVTQTFAGTTLNAGGTQIGDTVAGDVLALGAITHSAGNSTLFSSLTGGVTTSTANTSGILGPWAVTTVGTAVRYVTGNGTIAAYTGGTAVTTAAGITDTTGAVNYDVGLAANGTAQASVSANTIRFTTATALSPGATLFSVNGLLSGVNGQAATLGSGTLTIGANKDLDVITGNNTFNVNATIIDNSGGASSVTLDAQGGTIVLGGNNSYTGGTNVNGSAIVQLNNAGALGTTGNIQFNGFGTASTGGEIRYQAASAATDLSGRFKNSTAAIKLDASGQTVNLASVIDSSNTGGLALNSNNAGGKFVVSGANTYTGLTTITANASSTAATTVQLSGSGTLGNTSNSLDVFGASAGDDAILDLNGTTQSVGTLIGTSTGTITNTNATAGTLIIGTGNPGTNDTYAGAFSGNWNLVKNGGGTNTTLSLTAVNTGATTINGGVVTYTVAGTFASNGTGTVIINNGGQVTLSAGVATTTGASLPTIEIAGYGISSFGSAITSNGTNTIANNITLIDNAQIGGNTGTLTVAGNVTGTNVGLGLGGSAALDIISGNISLGDGGLTKTSGALPTNIWLLSGTNTYTGNTTLNTGGGGSGTGTLRAGSTQAFGGGTSSLNILSPAVNSPQTVDLNGNNNAVGSVFGGSATNGGDVTLGGATLTTGGDNTTANYLGSIVNPSAGPNATSSTLTGGGVTKVGTGKQTLSGASEFGTTTINGGTLATTAGIATSAATAGTSTTASATFASGATTISVTSATGFAIGESIVGTGIAANTVISNISGTTITLNTATTGTGGTAGEAISAGASLGTGASALVVSSTAGYVVGQVITGTGIASNTYVTGVDTTNKIVYLSNTTTGGGSVGQSVAGSAWQSLGSGALVFANTAGANLDISAGAVTVSPTVGSISGGGATGGTITLGANTLTTGNDGTNTTYGGAISGTGGLTKIGSGTQTLSGINGYTGATTISAGTLVVSGSTASGSAVSIASGATLGGAGLANEGTLSGTVTMASGGAINLQDGAIGTLHTGAVTVHGGTLSFDIGAGSSSNLDSIASTGSLTVTGTNTIVIGLVSGTPTLTAGTYSLIGISSGSLSSLTGFDFSNSTTTEQLASGSASYTLNLIAGGVSGLELQVVANTTSTTYTLGTSATSTLLHAGASTTVTTTLVNTGTGTADSIDYSGVGASNSGVGSLGAGTPISGNLANGNTAVSNTSQTLTTTAGTSGTATISSTGTLTNHTVGGTPSGTPTGTSVTVYSGFGTWSTNGSGSWGATPTATPANWTASGGTPGVTAGFTGVDTATFGPQSAPAITVGLNDAAPNLNAITFSSPDTAYTLAQNVSGGTGTNSITLSGTTPSINVTNPLSSATAGTQTISAPLILGATTSLNVASNQTLNIAGAVSSSGTFGFSNSGPGATMLSNAAGNTYSGPTTITGGTVSISNTSGSATGTGTVTVGTGSANSGVLAGKGIIANGVLNVNGGGSLVSGSPSQVSGTALLTKGGMTLASTPTTIGSSMGTANLTFDLAAGNSGINGGTASGTNDFSNPNDNTTYLSLTGSTTINFAGSTSISLVDLTNTTGSNGALTLRTGSPYLLIHAGANADYLNLVIASGTGANTTYSLSQGGANGYVVGVFTGGSTFNSASVGTAGYVTPITIAQYGPDGVTPLGSGPGGAYPVPALYLNAGDLEVVPEPGTWALMIGGFALLVVIQRRRSKSLKF